MAKIQVVCEKFTRFCGAGPPAVGRRPSKPFSEGFAEGVGGMEAAFHCNGRDGAVRFPEQLSMPGWDRGDRTAFFWEEYIFIKGEHILSDSRVFLAGLLECCMVQWP